MTHPNGSVRIYGAGGAGINNAAFYNRAGEEPNCADFLPAYVDASRSNLTSDMDEDSIFVLDNVDGSGKLRTENHQEIANVIKQILAQLPPGDLNIVVFSGSGGSGSVIGPLLVSELLKQGETVVCAVIGSDESVITAGNTLNTLKSLESIARRTEQPVCMFYEHNDRERGRSAVDRQLRLAISTLGILACKSNRELDSRDLANWTQFQRVTTVQPQLAQLEIFHDPSQLGQVKDPISVISLYQNADQEPADMVPEYHAAGYMDIPPEDIDQLHYVISIDTIPSVFGQVKDTLERYETQRGARVKQQSILGDDDNVTDDGIVI